MTQCVRLEIPERLRHNCRVKTFPDGSATVMVAERAIFREPGWELASDRQAQIDAQERAWQAHIEALDEANFDVGVLSEYALRRHEDAEAQKRRDSVSRAQRRARNAVRDLGLSNDWKYFVTLTLDRTRIDRYDMREITRTLNRWLDNHVRRDGLAYVLVPERHQDGAIHFHGLFNDALAAVDSGTVTPCEQAAKPGGRPKKPKTAKQREALLADGWQVVYNLPAWDLGFTTAIELYGDRRRAVNYVCKYVGKQQKDGTAGKIGGRWYYSGGALRRPAVTFCDVDYAELEAEKHQLFEIPELGCSVKIYET